MTKTKNKSLRVTKEVIEQRESERVAMKAKMAAAVADTAVLDIIKSQRKIRPKYQELFQEKPDRECNFTTQRNKKLKHNNGKAKHKKIINRSHTNSRESQQNGARKELEILKRNGRIPTKVIILRFQFQFRTKENLTDLLNKMFRYLGDKGIIAAVALEGTKGDFGKPNNRVHCHVLIDDKDAPLSKKKLVALFEKACKLRGLIRGTDIKIGFNTFSEDFTFDYFVKFGKHGAGIPLFKKGLRIQKFRYIGRWFMKPKPDLWDEYKAELDRINAANDTAEAEKPTKKSSAEKSK